MLSIANIIASL